MISVQQGSAGPKRRKPPLRSPPQISVREEVLEARFFLFLQE